MGALSIYVSNTYLRLEYLNIPVCSTCCVVPQPNFHLFFGTLYIDMDSMIKSISFSFKSKGDCLTKTKYPLYTVQKVYTDIDMDAMF